MTLQSGSQLTGEGVAIDCATWVPLDDNGLAEVRVNGQRITSMPSYAGAEQVANRINAALLLTEPFRARPAEALPVSGEGAAEAIDWIAETPCRPGCSSHRPSDRRVPCDCGRDAAIAALSSAPAGGLEGENARLREALTEIVDTVQITRARHLARAALEAST